MRSAAWIWTNFQLSQVLFIHVDFFPNSMETWVSLLISLFLFHLIWKDYILNQDFDL